MLYCCIWEKFVCIYFLFMLFEEFVSFNISQMFFIVFITRADTHMHTHVSMASKAENGKKQKNNNNNFQGQKILPAILSVIFLFFQNSSKSTFSTEWSVSGQQSTNQRQTRERDRDSHRETKRKRDAEKRRETQREIHWQMIMLLKASYYQYL